MEPPRDGVTRPRASHAVATANGDTDSHRAFDALGDALGDAMSTRRRPAAQKSGDTVATADRATRARGRRGPFTLPGDAREKEKKSGGACSAWFCAVCDVEDAPEWMIFNPHIRSGYRVGAGWLGATRSVFMRHNETVNIWTHLLGFLMFVALIVRTYRTATSGVGLAAPPEHWVTGADVARVERIQYATRWRQEIKRDWDALHAIDVVMHERLANTSQKQHIVAGVKGVKGELLDITHELAEHLRRGEEVFKVEKRRRALRQSLESVEKALDSIENAGGADLEPIHEQCNALRTKLGQLRAHIKGVPDDPEPARPVTRWPMYVFLSGAVVCLFFSTLCHTYCCIGARDAERMWRLDYLGIAVLIVSSFYPMVHYSYYCLPGWRDMYITGITSLGCLAAIPTLLTAFQKKEYGPLRASLFVALGLFGIFPIFQQILFVWRIVPTPMMEAFVLEMLMGGGYIVGAFLYAQGIPERWYPGLFDFIGCSHNIFHVLVVLSAYAHYKASLIYLTWRDNFTCEADHELLLEWYHLAAHFRYPEL